MVSLLNLVQVTCLSLLLPFATGTVIRDFSSLRTAYDYIVVGGGLSGLVVANRLTENPHTTVLVIEYGDLAPKHRNLTVPYFANFLQNDSYMLRTPSISQKSLGGRSFRLLTGATVGGGTVVNGMALTRGEKADYDTWEELGNHKWGWRDILTYFRRSTTLNRPSKAVVRKTGYQYSVDGYGNGPLQAVFPTFQYPDLYPMNDAWTKDIGIPIRSDGGTNGKILGVTWKPVSADPAKNFTRSSARTAHYDPASHRLNLHLLVNSYVGKVKISIGTATGVFIYSRFNKSAPAKFVPQRREVILAAGTINTAKILQLSGVGPRSILEPLNITVAQELAGVGANYQDHPTIQMSFKFNKPSRINLDNLNTNSSFFAEAWEEYITSQTGPITQAHGNTRTIMSLQDLTSSPSKTLTLLQSLSSVNFTSFLPPYYSAGNAFLLKGYAAQHAIQARNIAGRSALFEVTYAGNARIGIALQKPLSRGTVFINATNPHPEAFPLLNPATLTHPFDVSLAVLGLKMARRFMLSPAMAHLEVQEITPGLGVDTDKEIEKVLREQLMVPFNSHPCGTAAMLPLELGGVVDDRLQVYGVCHLRVVDASILPVIPAGHLQATMYAVAEKAAEIIMAGVEYRTKCTDRGIS